MPERLQIMEVVKNLTDEQVHYLLRIVQNLPPKEKGFPRCKLRGRFASYANPELRAKEKDAWGLAVEEKHGLR